MDCVDKIQLMTDKTGTRWAELLKQLQKCFSSDEYTLDASEGVKSSFFSFTRLCFAFRDLMLYENVSSLADLIEAQCHIPVLAGPQKEIPTTAAEKGEFLTRMIDRLARLKIRYVAITPLACNSDYGYKIT